MFFFKKRKVVVDCFINSETTYNLFKIDRAIKFAPKEWKTFPGSITQKVNQNPISKLTLEEPTIRKCIGVSNLFSKGFIIPSWTDFGLEVLKNGSYLKHDPMNGLHVGSHSPQTFWNDLYREYAHIKIYNPWLIRETTGVQFTWNQCDWHNTDRIDKFHVMSGVLDFQAQHGAHINAFMKKDSVINVNAGDPLVHVIPITDYDLDLRCHLTDQTEYLKIYKSYADRGMYSGFHRAMLEFKNKKKCPFNKS